MLSILLVQFIIKDVIMKNLFLALLATFTFSMAPMTFADDHGGADTEQGEEKKKKDSADC